MPTNIVLPSSMENGTLARWLKIEGDFVKVGDVLAEVETDKAMMEFQSTQEGVLTKIMVPQGTSEVAGGTVLAILTTVNEKTPRSEERATSKDTLTRALLGNADSNTLTPVERTGAIQLSSDVERGERLFASPRAKFLAGESGIDLLILQGSGPRGRIIERDVEAVRVPLSNVRVRSSERDVAKTDQHRANIDVPHSAESRDFVAARTYVEVPHGQMRKSIAKRLLESKLTVPHFYLSVDCELDALLTLKEQLNRAPPALADDAAVYKISVTDFIIKAWALALAHVPEANVSWTEHAMLKHRHVDVAVAVAIPGGLITPIVRRAESKALSAISNEIRNLALRATARKLRSEEYDGGTTTVSNLGMLGVKNFSAIVNPPHATILAVGTGEKCAVVKNDALTIATLMSCTLSADHRAVDGALGARVLAEFKRLIENPMAFV